MTQEEQNEIYAKIEGMTSRHVFAQLHGVPTNHREVYLKALAGALATELTQEEMIAFTLELPPLLLKLRNNLK